MISYLRSPFLMFLGRPFFAAQELPSSGRRNLVLLAVYQVQVQGKAIGPPFRGSVNGRKNIVRREDRLDTIVVVSCATRENGRNFPRNLENLNGEKSRQMFLKKCFESID